MRCVFRPIDVMTERAATSGLLLNRRDRHPPSSPARIISMWFTGAVAEGDARPRTAAEPGWRFAPTLVPRPRRSGAIPDVTIRWTRHAPARRRPPSPRSGSTNCSPCMFATLAIRTGAAERGVAVPAGGVVRDGDGVKTGLVTSAKTPRKFASAARSGDGERAGRLCPHHLGREASVNSWPATARCSLTTPSRSRPTSPVTDHRVGHAHSLFLNLSPGPHRAQRHPFPSPHAGPIILLGLLVFLTLGVAALPDAEHRGVPEPRSGWILEITAQESGISAEEMERQYYHPHGGRPRRHPAWTTSAPPRSTDSPSSASPSSTASISTTR